MTTNLKRWLKFGFAMAVISIAGWQGEVACRFVDGKLALPHLVIALVAMLFLLVMLYNEYRNEKQAAGGLGYAGDTDLPSGSRSPRETGIQYVGEPASDPLPTERGFYYPD
jgi:hypothetical protein